MPLPAAIQPVLQPELVRGRADKCTDLSVLCAQPNLSENIAFKCEAFICDLYPSFRISPYTADELRCFLFFQKRNRTMNKFTPTFEMNELSNVCLEKGSHSRLAILMDGREKPATEANLQST